MSKIGMLFCNNMKSDIGCSSVLCFNQLNKKEGAFDKYKDEETLELVGTMNCAGCPTSVGAGKILGQVRPLVEISGADAIHFSSCMVNICPFVNKYKKVIEEEYPNVKIVLGTHYSDNEEEMKKENEMFKGMVKNLLCATKPNMTDMVKEFNKTK